MLVSYHGYGEAPGPDGIGSTGGGCAPGKDCCPTCRATPVGGIEDRAGTLFDAGIGAAIGYMFAPRGQEVIWTAGGGALGGLVGKLGLVAILGFGLYSHYSTAPHPKSGATLRR